MERGNDCGGDSTRVGTGIRVAFIQSMTTDCGRSLAPEEGRKSGPPTQLRGSPDRSRNRYKVKVILGVLNETTDCKTKFLG